MEKDPYFGKNYTKKRFNIDKQISTFVVCHKETSEIVSVAGVYQPLHWPKEVARISNRYFINPKYRCKGLSSYDGYTFQYNQGSKPSGRYIQKLCYDDMIESCKKAGIKIAIISREIQKIKDCKKIDILLRTIRCSDIGWNKKDRLYLTCANKKASSCWQKIMYLSLGKESNIKILEEIDSISLGQWSKMFNKE